MAVMIDTERHWLMSGPGPRRVARSVVSWRIIRGYERQWHVSKAFGRYTRELGLGEKRQVFHALRNTFVEVMEAAEVPESTAKLIIGHARQSMTFGRYSKGKRVQLRKAINKLHYSAAVMRLVRKSTRGEGRFKFRS